jgi:hypothetical protein
MDTSTCTLPPIIVRTVGRLQEAGHAARMGRQRMHREFCWINLLEYRVVNGKITLKLALGSKVVRIESEWNWLTIRIQWRVLVLVALRILVLLSQR